VTTNGRGSATGSADDKGTYSIVLQLSPLPEPGAAVEVTVTTTPSSTADHRCG
jgi:hypothetical protein